jgi:hypothetical protein
VAIRQAWRAGNINKPMGGVPIDPKKKSKNTPEIKTKIFASI